MQTDHDEYSEPKVSSSLRERKLSSISEILDSSMSFLKENEWAEVGPNEPEAKSPDIIGGNIKKDEFAEQRVRFSNISSYIHYQDRSLQQDYVTNFMRNFSRRSSYEAGDVDRWHDSSYTFPGDILFDVKQKFTTVLTLAAKKTAEYVEQNKWYKTLVSPWIPSSLQPKVGQSVCCESESSIADKIKRLKLVTSNPYISPLLVSNDVLKEMPPVYFLVSVLLLYLCYSVCVYENIIVFPIAKCYDIKRFCIP